MNQNLLEPEACDFELNNPQGIGILSIAISLKRIADMMGEDRQPEPQQELQPEPIPAGVIYKPASGNFVDKETGRPLGKDFRSEWLSRKNEFPRE